VSQVLVVGVLKMGALMSLSSSLLLDCVGLASCSQVLLGRCSPSLSHNTQSDMSSSKITELVEKRYFSQDG